jgi:hypothetical protein
MELSQEIIDQAMSARFHCCDLDVEVSVREYLIELLRALWIEGERFSGKRPFGNSGWEYDLYKPLIEGGFVEGQLDEDGCVDTVSDLAHDFVVALIDSMGAK